MSEPPLLSIEPREACLARRAIPIKSGYGLPIFYQEQVAFLDGPATVEFVTPPFGISVPGEVEEVHRVGPAECLRQLLVVGVLQHWFACQPHTLYVEVPNCFLDVVYLPVELQLPLPLGECRRDQQPHLGNIGRRPGNQRVGVGERLVPDERYARI